MYNNVALLQKVRGRAGNCQKIQENPYSVALEDEQNRGQTELKAKKSAPFSSEKQ